MNRLTSIVLQHKRIVVGLWLAVTVAAFAAIGPAGGALSQTFSVPGREGFEVNQELAAIYGNGGDVAPLVPVVQLPPGTTVDYLRNVANPRAQVITAAGEGSAAAIAINGDLVAEDVHGSLTRTSGKERNAR